MTELVIGADASDAQLALAGEILATGRGTIILNGLIVLHRAGRYVFCAVIDADPSARRCENEYAVMVENASHMLQSSRILAAVPDLPRKWFVVEDSGNGAAVLWRAP